MHNPTIREVQYFKDGEKQGKVQAQKEVNKVIASMEDEIHIADIKELKRRMNKIWQ